MKSSPFPAAECWPHRATSTAACFLVILLSPLMLPTDARAGGHGWQRARDPDNPRIAWPQAAAPLSAERRAEWSPRATPVIGIRG